MLRHLRRRQGGAGTGTRGLEENVEIGTAAKLGAERGQVEIEGAENVEHRRVLIEQRFHVDEIHGPAAISQDSLAKREPLGAERLGPPGIFHVRWPGHSKQPRPVRIMVRGRVGRVRSRADGSAFS
jgi:hypothetical protein